MKEQKNKKEPKISKMKKPNHVTVFVISAIIMIIIWQLMNGEGNKIKEVNYSQFLNMSKSGQVVSVDFDEKDVYFTDTDGDKYYTYMVYRDPELVRNLEEKGISIKSRKPSQILSVLVSSLPFLLFIFFWMFIMRSMQGSGSKAFSFGKSKAKLFAGGKTNKTFADVAGVEEAKEELEEIVEYLRDPKKFQRLGGRIPRGVLLLGRPGTGKTLLAKAVAGEAGVPFFSMSGSDFVEMFVGVGASRVRDLFENAKRSSPCIAFIDEIDAVGRSRGAGIGGGHDEREQTLNQLLVEMDGFEQNDSVIIIAATNRPDVLDPALLRPGRFDRQVMVDLPDIRGREAILKVHCKSLPIGEDVKLSLIARSTPGFSGADLANLANESALLAARKNKKIIEMEDFEEAKDKVTMGKAKKSRVISEEEKRMTSYHEIGHVLCSIFQIKTEPVHKVTIIPRGFSLGATHSLQSDKTGYSRKYLEQKLVELMGGRVAEELIFDELTTGAGSDIQRATDTAKKMVCSWGMSRKLGPMTVGKEEGNVFLGKELASRDFHSEDTAKIVDGEIRSIIHTAHQTAMDILFDKRDLLVELSELLLEAETLNTDEIFEVVNKYVKDESEKELVDKKYKAALEMRIDHREEECGEKTSDIDSGDDSSEDGEA